MIRAGTGDRRAAVADDYCRHENSDAEIVFVETRDFRIVRTLEDT